MNIFVLVVVGSIALCNGEENSNIPEDNSHFVEGKSRYIWMPDREGNPRLVDLHVPVNETMVRSARNGANNQYWLFTRQGIYGLLTGSQWPY